MIGFHIDPARPLSEEVLRILREQAVLAREALEGPDRDVGVHEARKAAKRARAVLRMVRPALEPSVSTRLERGFRDAARAVGSLRDAHVVPRTLATVAGDLQGLAWDVADGPADPEAAVAAALGRLQLLQDDLGALELRRLHRDQVLVGVQRAWRDARSIMAEASDDADADAMHDWRKAAKRVFYQAQLLEPLWPAVLGALVAELDALQEVLGAHHDLAVVAEVLERSGSDPEAIGHLEARLAARSAELEGEAFERGRRIFALRPRLVIEVLEELWSAD